MDAPTPYERGVQYGRQAAEEINTSIAYYKKKFEKKFTWDAVLDYSRKFQQATEEFDRDIADELRGIADGSGHTAEEIMAVNARYEISQFDWKQECSTGICFNSHTGKNYLFKNCDLSQGVKNHLVVLRIVREDGFRAIGVSEAGQLIRDGYNNCGIGLVNSALTSKEDGAGMAVPGTVIRKKVWESRTLEEACRIQRNAFRTVSTNMLIASRDGQAVDFECYPGGEDEVLPRNGIISTGNRFTVNPGRNRVEDPDIDRGKRLRELLEEYGGRVDENTLKEILKDHKGYPSSICRHISYDHSTVYSIIINLTDSRVYICPGNPCEFEYEEYVL